MTKPVDTAGTLRLLAQWIRAAGGRYPLHLNPELAPVLDEAAKALDRSKPARETAHQ